jgi:hypothetical protein
MAERMSLVTGTQLGPETVSGTSVAASKIAQTFAVMMHPNPESRQYQTQGVTADTLSQLVRDSTEGEVTGIPSYSADAYILSSMYGAATQSTAGTAGNKWLWSDDGALIVPKTYTIEQGSAVRAGKVVFGAFNGYGWKWSRKDLTLDGIKWLAQQYQDGITMTAAPTRLPETAINPGDFNFYLDTTSGGLGTTRLDRVYEVSFGHHGRWKGNWPSDRAAASWTTLVMAKAQPTIKLKVQGDLINFGTPLTYLRTGGGQKVFFRAAAQGILLPGEASTNYLHQTDVACYVGPVGPLEDVDGVWGTEIELIPVFDSTWGHLLQVTLQNKLTAL